MNKLFFSSRLHVHEKCAIKRIHKRLKTMKQTVKKCLVNFFTAVKLKIGSCLGDKLSAFQQIGVYTCCGFFLTFFGYQFLKNCCK